MSTVPTMDAGGEAVSQTLELERRHALGVMIRRDLVLVRGSGATVVDEDGRAYIDCVAGHGAALLGHSHPAVVAAINRQAARLMTCTAGFYNDVRAELLAELTRLTPPTLDRVFLCNSGTEAVEAALKFARASTGRRGFVCARGSFHGRTMGALSATFEPRYREPFVPLVPGFEFVPFNDCEALREAVGEDTAAVILEPVQGEGGVHVAEDAFLAAARDACDATGALLILDEVQTGFGRTGRTFAFQHSGVVPDLLCLAKGMAGGFPIGAVVCSERIQVTPGTHGTTFGGNPLASAAAVAALRVLVEHRLAEEAARKGAWLTAKLEELDLPVVREVRGRGLMIGIALKRKVRPTLERLAELGVLALPAGLSVLRLLPPLVISAAELETVLGALATALGE